MRFKEYFKENKYTFIALFALVISAAATLIATFVIVFG